MLRHAVRLLAEHAGTAPARELATVLWGLARLSPGELACRMHHVCRCKRAARVGNRRLQKGPGTLMGHSLRVSHARPACSVLHGVEHVVKPHRTRLCCFHETSLSPKISTVAVPARTCASHSSHVGDLPAGLCAITPEVGASLAARLPEFNARDIVFTAYACSQLRDTDPALPQVDRVDTCVRLCFSLRT